MAHFTSYENKKNMLRYEAQVNSPSQRSILEVWYSDSIKRRAL